MPVPNRRTQHAIGFSVVALIFAAGVGWSALAHWREGPMLMAMSAALAAFLRLVLPDSQRGLLAVRSRGFDIAVYGLFAVALALLAIFTPGTG